MLVLVYFALFYISACNHAAIFACCLINLTKHFVHAAFHQGKAPLNLYLQKTFGKMHTLISKRIITW